MAKLRIIFRYNVNRKLPRGEHRSFKAFYIHRTNTSTITWAKERSNLWLWVDHMLNLFTAKRKIAKLKQSFPSRVWSISRGSRGRISRYILNIVIFGLLKKHQSAVRRPPTPPVTASCSLIIVINIRYLLAYLILASLMVWQFFSTWRSRRLEKHIFGYAMDRMSRCVLKFESSFIAS